MSIKSSVIYRTVKYSKYFRKDYANYGYVLQQDALIKLLKKSQNTEFGKYYKFNDIIKDDLLIKAFQENIPVFDYNSIYTNWWYKTLDGKEDICWPGKTKYFALTSGTSDSASKRIPVTSDMIQSIVKAGFNQFLTLSNYTLPKSFYDKSILMVGGSVDLVKKDKYLEGDLSGILTSRLPLWFNTLYKPGKKIAAERNWTKKLELMTLAAPKWDIGGICGVPAWIQILIEKIIDHYKLNNIHEIWPNFKFYVHGGVSFEPYKKGFSKYLGHEIFYQDTYLASEGFFAIQNRSDAKGMQLVLNNGTFFEFIPFNRNNFTSDGDLKENYECKLLDEVDENQEYAMIISTNAGAWRYLIGDVIKFSSLENYEVVITGRTKHFLSLCGEHLSVDNMNNAINILAHEFDLNIKEYTVAGIPHDNLFAHKWFIGTDKYIDNNILSKELDKILKNLNDDYATERLHALKEVIVETLPNDVFYEWMKSKGKEGGQNKFPRVLNATQLPDWEKYIELKKTIY